MPDVLPDSNRKSVLIRALRLVHDRNPFYLVSALCMFVGFRVILGALNSEPGDWKTLLGLIITLQVYEVAMIGLALILILRCGLRRDGWILLGIEALFLVDLTNLNAELFTAVPALGAVVNAVCFLLAIGKVLFVVRALGLRLTPQTTFYIAAQLAFLLGMPGMFRIMRSPDGAISAMQIYAVWWMAAALVAGGAFLVKKRAAEEGSPMAALPWRLYVVVPLISLIVHLCSENRVYWVHFHYANAGPLLLAFVVVLNQSKWRLHPATIRASVCLAALAVLVSLVPGAYQHELSGRMLGLRVSPMRLILLGSALIGLWLAIRHQSMIAATGLAGCLALASMGTNMYEIKLRWSAIVRGMLHTAQQLTPDTPAQWGVVAIGAAFLLLGVGAWVSLKAASHGPVLEPPA